MMLFVFSIAIPIMWAQATGSITGIVTDANTHAPVAKAQVSAGEQVELTDNSGTFSLHNLPASDTKLRVGLDGYRNAEISVPLAPGDLLKRDFELHPLARITGRARIRDTERRRKRQA